MAVTDETAYIAWGVDHETNPEDPLYWIAVWNDDGPQSEERTARTREAARSIAETWASEVGLEAVEVDEFGDDRLPSLLY